MARRCTARPHSARAGGVRVGPRAPQALFARERIRAVHRVRARDARRGALSCHGPHGPVPVPTRSVHHARPQSCAGPGTARECPSRSTGAVTALAPGRAHRVGRRTGASGPRARCARPCRCSDGPRGLATPSVPDQYGQGRDRGGRRLGQWHPCAPVVPVAAPGPASGALPGGRAPACGGHGPGAAAPAPRSDGADSARALPAALGAHGGGGVDVPARHRGGDRHAHDRAGNLRDARGGTHGDDGRHATRLVDPRRRARPLPTHGGGLGRGRARCGLHAAGPGRVRLEPLGLHR